MNAQRGQTIPFWAITTVIVIAMTAFLASFVNTVTWQVRAQNAADSAAAAGLSVYANVLNEESTLLYTAAVDEYRIRAVNQAMLNAMNGTGGCQTNLTCGQDYQALYQEYSFLVAQSGALASDIQLLRQANNFTQGGQLQDERKAVQSFGNCSQPGGGFDCAFTYNIVWDSGGNNGNGKKKNQLEQVDVVACRLVPYFAPALYIAGSNTAFQAVGRSAAAIVPAASTEVFSPGIAANPITGTVYQPPESAWNGYQVPDPGLYYTVNFSGLTVNLNWYTSATIYPPGGQATYNSSLNNSGSTSANLQYGCSTP